MYCPNCGERLSEQALFCPKCGTKRQSGDTFSSGKTSEQGSGNFNQPQPYVQPQPGPYIQPPQPQPTPVRVNIWMPDYQCTFGNAIKRFFNGFVQFKGRSSIREYWFAILFLFITNIVSALIPFIGWIWGLVVILPSIAVAIRRLHDSNRSGWWYLAGGGCSMLGAIVLFIGGVGSIISAASGSYSYGSSSTLGGMMVWLVFGFLFVIGGLVINIWLYTRPSDPAGARYDDSYNC